MNYFDKLLIAGFVKGHFLIANSSNDPMEIITDSSMEKVSTKTSAMSMLDLPNLFYLIKKNALLITAIVVLLIFITMLFIHKPETRADKKKDVLHKLGIAFLICSAPILFYHFKKVCDEFLL